MSNHGLEWLFRITQDPKRMAKRYLVDDRKILGLAIKYLVNLEQIKDRMTYYIKDKKRIIRHAENGVNQLEKYTIEHQLVEFEKIYKE